ASNYGEPLLADFGLARLQSEKSVTRTAGVTASFAHAAPEILDGLPATEASDVYALGSTLYTLLAGRPPFVHDTDETLTPLIARVIRDPLPELQSAGVSGDVWACIERAMAKHPDDRIPTARDLGERLQTTQVAAGVPVTPLRLGSPDSASVDEIVGPQAAGGATRRVAGRKSRSQARTATDRQLQTPRIPAPVAP